MTLCEAVVSVLRANLIMTWSFESRIVRTFDAFLGYTDLVDSMVGAVRCSRRRLLGSEEDAEEGGSVSC